MTPSPTTINGHLPSHHLLAHESGSPPGSTTATETMNKYADCQEAPGGVQQHPETSSSPLFLKPRLPSDLGTTPIVARDGDSLQLRHGSPHPNSLVVLTCVLRVFSVREGAKKMRETESEDRTCFRMQRGEQSRPPQGFSHVKGTLSSLRGTTGTSNNGFLGNSNRQATQ